MRKMLAATLFPTVLVGCVTLGISEPAGASKVSKCVASSTATITQAYDQLTDPSETLQQVLQESDLKAYCKSGVGDGAISQVSNGNDVSNSVPVIQDSYTLHICGAGFSPCDAPPNDYTALLEGWVNLTPKVWVSAYDHTCYTNGTIPWVGVTTDFCGWVSVDGDPAGIGGYGYRANYALLRYQYTVGLCSPVVGCLLTLHKWYWINVYNTGGWKWGCREC
jgi:hypothetical protein